MSSLPSHTRGLLSSSCHRVPRSYELWLRRRAAELYPRAVEAQGGMKKCVGTREGGARPVMSLYSLDTPPRFQMRVRWA